MCGIVGLFIKNPKLEPKLGELLSAMLKFRVNLGLVGDGDQVGIERRGSFAGHQYQLLGHTIGKTYTIEPYLITISDKSEVYPEFQHAGTEFIYMLEGKVTYRHANKTYLLEPGDSLFFDAEALHGPDEILELPCRFLAG